MNDNKRFCENCGERIYSILDAVAEDNYGYKLEIFCSEECRDETSERRAGYFAPMEYARNH